jgi:RNA polymerase sigma-70 factor (ECF subfamily)
MTATPRRPPARRAPLERERDALLVELASDGDERAFAALVARHRPALLAHCRSIVGNAAADDAVQHAFVSAWYSLQRRVEVHRARAWLFTIAHRAALQVLRDRREQPVELRQTVAGGRSPLELLVQAESARAALKVLARLPDRERDALVSTSLDGRSGRDLALKLGIAEGAVRQLVFRARARARAAVPSLVPPAILSRLRALLAAPARHPATVAQRAIDGAQAWPASARVASLAAAAALAGASAAAVQLAAPHDRTAQSGARAAAPRAAQRALPRSHEQRARPLDRNARLRRATVLEGEPLARPAVSVADRVGVSETPQRPQTSTPRSAHATPSPGPAVSGIAGGAQPPVPLPPPIQAPAAPEAGALAHGTVSGVGEDVESVVKSTQHTAEPLVETARQLLGH